MADALSRFYRILRRLPGNLRIAVYMK